MSFRRQALEGVRFDEQLRGEGAQYRNDSALCLKVKRRGWKLIYDPKVAIDHFYAVRYGEDKRIKFNPIAVSNLAHNEMLLILDYMNGWQRFSCVLYSLLVSSIATPGILQFLRMIVLQKGSCPWLRLIGATKGKYEGFKTWLSSRSVKKVQTAAPRRKK